MGGKGKEETSPPKRCVLKDIAAGAKRGLGSLLVKGPLHVKGPELALDERLRAIFPSVGSGPGEELDDAVSLLGISNLQSHIDEQITKLSDLKDTTDIPRHGIIGGPIIEIDRDSVHVQDPLQFHYSNCPNTDLESRCNFLSARANACVYDGAWMYEANINTGGVQQIGWATDECIFSNENGVGDAEHSYAFDGKRVKLWNQGAVTYGEAWVPGDVIGCGIDLTNGTVSFWRNGKALGVASSNVATGPERAYYPALSLALRERCRLNFGGTPLSFPVEGYSPLQAPEIVNVRVATWLANAITQTFVQFHTPNMDGCDLGTGYDSVVRHNEGEDGDTCEGATEATALDAEVAVALEEAILDRGRKLHCSADAKVQFGMFAAETGDAAAAPADRPGSRSSSSGSVSDSNNSSGSFWPRASDAQVAAALTDALEHGKGLRSNSITNAVDDVGPADGHGADSDGDVDGVVRASIIGAGAAFTKIHIDPNNPVKVIVPAVPLRSDTGYYPPAPQAAAAAEAEKAVEVAAEAEPHDLGNEDMLKLVCCSHALGALMPIFTPYVHASVMMRLLMAPIYLMVSPCAIKSFFNTMRAVLPTETFHKVVQMTLMDIGCFIARNTPWTGCELPIKLARLILTNREAAATMACFDEGVVHKIFSGIFTNKLMAVKDAETVFPKIWWRTAPPGFDDETIRERCQFFSQAILYLMEELHAIARSMLQDNEPFPADWLARVPGARGRSGVTPAPIADSPRGLFEWWLAKLVKLNLGLTQQVIPVGTSDHTVLCNVQGALSRVFVDMIAERPEDLDGLEDVLSYTENIGAPHDLPRLGGLYSHLKAEYYKEVAKGAIAPPTKAPAWTQQFQLLDWSVILFSLAMVNPLRQLTNAHVEVDRAMEQEQLAQARLKSVDPSNTEAVEVLKQGVDVSCDRIMSFIRSVTLFEVAYMDKVKAAVFEKWSGLMTTVLLKAQKGPHFDFVPEAHVNVVLHAFTVIHTESSVFSPAPKLPYFLRTESSQKWLLNYARLVVALVSDSRVKSPDLNVTVIAKMKSLLGVPEYLRFLEQDKDLCRGILEVLMKCFDDRFWVPSTDILVRFWGGLGFGGHRVFNPELKKPLALGHLQSATMRTTFQEMCKDSPVLVSTYLNHLINHLNWTVSEFDQMLEEIRRIGDRPDRGGDQVFRRCIVTHTLGINLLRLLEGFAVASRGRKVDTTNLVRVVQLLLHLLNRLTGNDQLVDTVLAMKLMPLQHVCKQALVDPILGTLLTLVGDLPAVDGLTKAKIEENPALKAIMQDGALRPKLLRLLRGVAGHLSGCSQSPPEEGAGLLKFCTTTEVVYEVWAAAEAEEEEGDDENLCTICYVYELNASMMPCKHQSCKTCIDRHLMNSKKCFFCNADIDDVIYADASNGDEKSNADDGGGAGVDDADAPAVAGDA